MSWTLKSGETVIDRYNSHIHEDVTKYLIEALSQIESQNRSFVIEVIEFQEVIGNRSCVSTDSTDRIIFAKRPKRFSLTRFVMNRFSEPCRTLVVILKSDGAGGYIVITSFVGKIAEPEPWDDRSFSQKEDPHEAKLRSRRFWAQNALVWGEEEIISGTETTRCPW